MGTCISNQKQALVKSSKATPCNFEGKFASSIPQSNNNTCLDIETQEDIVRLKKKLFAAKIKAAPTLQIHKSDLFMRRYQAAHI